MHSIYHNLTIKVATKQVFKAITNPEQLIHWWPLKCKGKPALNEVYNFYFSPEYDWLGEVIQLESNRSFKIKMTQSDKDWLPTTFGFELEKVSNTTLLRFSHTGWQQTNDHYRTTSFCWAMLLNGLKNYCEKGVIIPFEERN